MNRAFVRSFNKQPVNLIKSTTTNLARTPSSVKFRPMEFGNSFKTFKEYRLRAVNQSPLFKKNASKNDSY
ncbi:hypothetical protein CANTEDRAFT_114944 [Yamadazyma tenuis ATCC 10573]|uniref:Uncharacterized protein n=1 Tax=Candida tenuis (strain ATCC 10573 / BCRC 21748 / CBS 615 / JCM 9827 / NBRC 10315 / NRRL Y-1498 / VKM Y-70) TaxID=590646 RepID=G3BAY4_CANTC|nr:uncharacterized protein CANTEDRAFT_114944 [Yamadazyma tenuis ATCC 10573]XP_006688709.1 uncharacterized protein CANTEDRAFT_114944 [Yamadazyma tenuis ATCC 10573]EGV62538.1 hypothetical protein CANTEDRAFT_114944 [Yamadazyma tenuis ATCC 10573]EGV62539.1 hypothetical protein CANTEDRAFT_114944 [Yamadazyma tenuis ATCC 10573]